MKYRIIINLVLFFLLTAALQAQEPVDDFRGLEWGDKLSEASFIDNANPDFQKEGELSNASIYSLKDEDLTIGSVTLKDIHYHFNDNGQFVRLVLDGREQYNEDMESILMNKLGDPSDVIMRQYEIIRIWEQEDVTIIFREQQSRDFLVDFRSKIDLKQKMKQNINVDDF